MAILLVPLCFFPISFYKDFNVTYKTHFIKSSYINKNSAI